MRGTIKIKDKVYYAYDTGSREYCREVAKKLRLQGREARIRLVTSNKWGVFVLPKKTR